MTPDAGPPNGPSDTTSDRPGMQQYSLKALMAVVTGMALLFGVLTWFGLRGGGALIAFGSAGGAALAAIACIEFFWACRKRFWISRNDRIQARPGSVTTSGRVRPPDPPPASVSDRSDD